MILLVTQTAVNNLTCLLNEYRSTIAYNLMYGIECDLCKLESESRVMYNMLWAANNFKSTCDKALKLYNLIQQWSSRPCNNYSLCDKVSNPCDAIIAEKIIEDKCSVNGITITKL